MIGIWRTTCEEVNRWWWPNILNLTGKVYLLAGSSEYYCSLGEGEFLGKMGIPRSLVWALLTNAFFVD